MEPDNPLVLRNAKRFAKRQTFFLVGLAAFILFIAAIGYLLARRPLTLLIRNWLRPLENYDYFLSSVKYGFTTFSVLLLLALISLLRLRTWRCARQDTVKPEAPQPISTRHMVSFIAPLIVVLAGAIAINIYVNPRRMYGTNFYLPWVVNVREIKVNLYDKLPNLPDMVILGSSRAFSISPQYIKQTLGYDSFNMSVESGYLNDSLIMARYMSDQKGHILPKVLLVETPFSFDVADGYTASTFPLRMIPFMEPSTAILAVRTRLEAAINVQQVAEAWWLVKYVAQYKRQPQGFKVDSDGMLHSDQTPADLDAAIAPFIQSIQPHVVAEDCPPLAVAQQTLTELIQLAEQHKTALIFYRSPLHPKYLAAMAAKIQNLQACNQSQLNYIQRIAQHHDNIFILDFALLNSINGLDTSEGYYDHMHLTPLNAERLIDAAADTIQSAYAWATSKRNSDD